MHWRMKCGFRAGKLLEKWFAATTIPSNYIPVSKGHLTNCEKKINSNSKLLKGHRQKKNCINKHKQVEIYSKVNNW